LAQAPKAQSAGLRFAHLFSIVDEGVTLLKEA